MKTTYPNGINVLSLFDGIACGRLALDKAGITIDKYYSSEICPHALAIQDYHYSDNPNFIQLGDVCKIDGTGHLSNEIDLAVFGSPCTSLSSINPKDKRGLQGNESRLFYEALRILKEIKNSSNRTKELYFLMENVASMSNRDRDEITKELQVIDENVQLIKINSAIISSSNRRRYYWTNIPNIQSPEPNNSKYSDVLVNGYVDREKANVLLGGNVTLTNGINRHYKMGLGNIIFKNEDFSKLPLNEKLKQYPAILNKSRYIGKSRTIQDEYDFPNGCYRLPSVLECSRLMGIPDNYLCPVPNVSKSNKIKAIGLGFTVDVIAHILASLKPFLK